DSEGAFFVEGIRPVWQAVEGRATIETLVVAPELLTSAPASEMIEAQRRAGCRVVEVSPRVFESIAEREHPSGVGAIVRSGLKALDELVVESRSCFVALEGTGNPGNLGTIIRTVDGAGGSGVVLIGAGTDPFHPTAVKASMGTLFTVPVARAENLEEVAGWCRSRGVRLVTTSSRAPTVYWSASLQPPLVLLFGSEGEGLSDREWEGGDLAVRIPMSGAADSLNLAVSVGVLLYEFKRQQDLRAAPG
ncbi:MAG: TrmH family RNA methyltransferase, partial [Rudaea sp.]